MSARVTAMPFIAGSAMSIQRHVGVQLVDQGKRNLAGSRFTNDLQ